VQFQHSSTCWRLALLLNKEKHTVQRDSFDHSGQELVVVDNVEQVESKEIAMKQCTSHRHAQEHLKPINDNQRKMNIFKQF
jgi:hypothetical protein